MGPDMPLAVRSTTLSWRHCFVPTLSQPHLWIVILARRSMEAPPEGTPTTRQCHLHYCLLLPAAPAFLLPSGLWANPNQEKNRQAAPATSTATMRYGRWGSFSGRAPPHQEIWHNPFLLLELPTHSRPLFCITASKFTIGHPPDHPSPVYIYGSATLHVRCRILFYTTSQNWVEKILRSTEQRSVSFMTTPRTLKYWKILKHKYWTILNLVRYNRLV